MLIFLVTLSYVLVISVSNSVLLKNLRNDLIMTVEDNVDEVEYYDSLQGVIDDNDNDHYFAYEDGYVVYTCALCESTYTEILPSIGHEHNYVEVDRVPATEDEDGYIIYSCTECGDTYTETIPALGPSGGDDEEGENP